LDLPWKIGKSVAHPDLIMMDPDDQPPYMSVRQAHLDTDDASPLFTLFRCALPDFLAQAGRLPMPRARWKELFAITPSSRAAMDQQLAKLMEQVFWSMVTDPTFVLPSNTTPAVAVETETCEVPLEDWMVEPVKADSKRKKRKKKNKPMTADASNASREDEEVEEEGFDEPEKEEQAEVVPAVLFDDRDELSGDDGHSRCKGRVQNADSASNHETHVEEVEMPAAALCSSEFGLGLVIDGSLQAVNDQASEEQRTLQDSKTESDVPQASSDVSQAPGVPAGSDHDIVMHEHYWGALGMPSGRRKPMLRKMLDRATQAFAPRYSKGTVAERPDGFSTASSSTSASANAGAGDKSHDELDAADTVTAHPPRGCHLIREEGEDHASDVDSHENPDGARLTSPAESSQHAWKPSQLVRYIWNQTSQMEQDNSLSNAGLSSFGRCVTPSLETTATSTPWSAQRGFWASPSEGSTPAGVRVLERNGFLEIEEGEEEPKPVRTRSLSPSRMKNLGYPSMASLSTNHWYR